MANAVQELDADLTPREQEQLLYLDICQETEQLRAHGVRVYWQNDSGWKPDETAFLVQYLDDGQWVLLLGRSGTREEHLRALQDTWSVLTTRSDLDNRLWAVSAADPDEPGSLPTRQTAWLRRLS